MVLERALIPFPGTPTDGLGRIDVEVDWEGRSSLFVTFRIRDFATLGTQRRLIPVRRDGLWQHTCCEVFGRRQDGTYIEFNLAPAGNWAAYQFTGYREDMANLEVPRPTIRWTRIDGGFQMEAFIPSPEWPHIEAIGLSAVIEGYPGAKTYWALTHPSDMPDFHHADSFALISPALERP